MERDWRTVKISMKRDSRQIKKEFSRRSKAYRAAYLDCLDRLYLGENAHGKGTVKERGFTAKIAGDAEEGERGSANGVEAADGDL